MAESNDAWGVLSEHDDELASAWDGYDRLPEPGENPVLDAFCERKNISIQSLIRLGTKLAEPDVLAFAYDQGIKFRNMQDGKMWSYIGSTWPHMKIVRGGAEQSDALIVCEGETDGARLTSEYDCDVGIMPGGARNFPESMGQQLEPYSTILMGLDKDEAGEDGCTKIAEYHNNTVRFPAPGSGDWSDYEGDFPEIPEAPTVEDLSSELLVPAGTMLTMEVPDITSYLEHAILPVGGLMILHGWAKSFKTFMALDLLSRLSQGHDWCCFEPTEEPVKTCAIQFEIPWAYYHERVQLLQSHALDQPAFDENFYTWTPMQRPKLMAGDKRMENIILRALTRAGIQIVLVDPIRRATGQADMNAEHEVRKMLAFFERMQDEGITVVATHHDNKEGAKAGGGSTLSMTGSGAFAGDPDTIISVETIRGDDPDTSPRRNLNFALRNAPAIGPRSMQIMDDGRIVYDTEPITSADDEDFDDDVARPPSI